MTTSREVLVFVPNLIGYARIILAILSCYYMPIDYVTAGTCYVISGLLDALDGHAARYLNQTSLFGAMLDQLTDRCATACLLITLAMFYPDYAMLFQMSTALDIASHWLHLHSTILSGRTSHKAIDLDENPILHFYYTNRKFLFFMCAGNEMFYTGLYLLFFTPGPTVAGIGLFKLLTVLAAPVAVVKSLISFIHLIAAALNIASLDAAQRDKPKSG
ncbi:CDP-diacylglycerol--inositol 3-phosphatidyltransferase-like [Watersipora subatra]|uniref:CDP-diacylglycerol--inositol 3-phosphatidyltransferase-like n=1 Tax=Watersipora subatra TaxID=2589382 RepID=UPI00355C26B4